LTAFITLSLSPVNVFACSGLPSLPIKTAIIFTFLATMGFAASYISLVVLTDLKISIRKISVLKQLHTVHGEKEGKIKEFSFL
jgi:hypothetical protein